MTFDPSPTSTEIAVAKLVEVARLRDPNLAAHSDRTAEVACALGAELGCSFDTLETLYRAAQLHDIGKLSISEAILWKPAELNGHEWDEIRTHPERGNRLVSDIVPAEVAAAVLYHHERFDYDGYPYGIDASSLPLVVRIIQVADAFDAMTSNRPYQPPVPVPDAVAEIKRWAGRQFDVAVTRALVTIYAGRTDPTPPAERRQTETANGFMADLDRIATLSVDELVSPSDQPASRPRL